MPLQTVQLQPGIDVEATPTLNKLGWSLSGLVRFFQGFLQKLGGWVHINAPALIGTGRGMHAWADLSGNAYVAAGTEQRLQLVSGGVTYDITPLRKSSTIAPNFSTTMGSPTVKVTDAANGASTSDWIYIEPFVSVDGIILQGFYQVGTIVDASDYDITAGSNGIAGVSSGGAVPSYNTSGSGVTVVTVMLANHGLANGQTFQVFFSTTVGGITIAPGLYAVSSVTTNTFQITPGGTSSGGATTLENGGDVSIEYLIPTGLASATAEGGYGTGPYGSGPYGQTSGTSLIAPLRQWFLDNWGQDLIGSYTGSPIYVWIPPNATGNLAIPINTSNYPGALEPPTQVNGCFVAMPAQILVAWGCAPFGSSTLDPNLVRWCDVADFTDWEAEATNQAGSFRIPTGSRIVGALQAGNFGFIWTDVDVWVMSYMGFPLVFSFNKQGSGCGLLSARGAGVLGAVPYWVSSSVVTGGETTGGNFWTMGASGPQIVACPVWDIFFENLNQQQKDKVWCWVNSWFGEIWWFFPSQGGNGECDSYVKMNQQGQWDYGLGVLPRVCGVDMSALGPPIAVDASGLVQQHEVGFDADGQPMMPFVQSGWMSIADGEYFTFIERVLADFAFEGGTAPNNRVFYEILVADYPTDTPTVYGPYVWAPTGASVTPYSIVRARGRVAAIRIYSTDIGVFWRLGRIRYNAAPAGRRP
jgi:hypothetical protein